MTILEWYQRIYDSLIEKRRKNPLTKDKTDPNYIYCETHHILPKSLGGLDIEENLVNLTAREHLIAHMLLVKIYEKNGNKNAYIKMSYALVAMKNLKAPSNVRDNNMFSSRLYQSLIEKSRIFTKEHKQNISKARKGYKLSAEKKKELKEKYQYKKEHGLIKPKVIWNKGIPMSEQTKQKIRTTFAIFNKNKGRILSIESKIIEIKTWLTNKYPMIDFNDFDFETYAKIPRHKVKDGKYMRRIFLEEYILKQISKEELERITKEYNISHPCGKKGKQITLEDKIKQAKTRLKNLYPTIDFSSFNFKEYCSIDNKGKRKQFLENFKELLK